MIRHLRSNLVAYLALALVLGMGSAHAASAIANGSVTTKKLKNNAVTTAKIRADAVTGAKIKDGTVAASDLAVGLVPRDGFLFTATTGADPVAVPDYLDPAMSQAVTLPRAGTAFVRWSSDRFGAECSAGSARAGIYVDGVPARSGAFSAPGPSDSRAFQLQGSIDLAAGAHTLQVGVDCPSGSWSLTSYGNRTWWVELVAQ